MSFSSKVKGEICRYVDISKGEALSEISAIMKVSGTLAFSGSGLSFKMTTENTGFSEEELKLIEELG